MIKTFSTEHLRNVFSEEGKYDAFKNAIYDFSHNIDMFDDDGNKLTKAEANKGIRRVIFDILGVNEKSTKRDRKRAWKKHGMEVFEVIEEDIDLQISEGFKENEFFNSFVEERNLSLGDSQEFYSKDDILLAVGKTSGGHHDLIMQTLKQGETYTIPTSVYYIKVGQDIDLYLTGRIDWTEFIDACTKAFTVQIQNDIYSAMTGASAKLPSAFKGTGALGSTTKDQFDAIIENVSAANDNAPVYILGTKTALKKITGLADVDWANSEQKDAIANYGRLGYYEGTTLMEIPQRLANKTDFSKLYDNTKLYIFPMTEDRFIKFVNEGETEIMEQTEKGETMDDMMTYEIQRRMGIGIQLGRYFGEWTISA